MLTSAILLFFSISATDSATAPTEVRKDPVICKTSVATGSRLNRVKKCARKSEIEAEAAATQKALDDRRLAADARYQGNN